MLLAYSSLLFHIALCWIYQALTESTGLYTYQPYSWVNSSALIGIFSFDDSLVTNGRTHTDAKGRDGLRSTDSISVQSLYSAGAVSMSLNIPIDPIANPSVTFGAWVKVINSNDSNKDKM